MCVCGASGINAARSPLCDCVRKRERERGKCMCTVSGCGDGW